MPAGRGAVLKKDTAPFTSAPTNHSSPLPTSLREATLSPRISGVPEIRILKRKSGTPDLRRGEGKQRCTMQAPRVLISDALSPAAVQIFKDRGIDVDFQPDLGKDKDKLAAIIGDYDGLAIRSATKVTAKILERATNLKVIGRAGIGVDNVEIPAATAKGVIVMNTPFGNSITTAEHAIAMMFALARQIPQADA